MKTQLIELDKDEDLILARDRIQWSDARQIILSLLNTDCTNFRKLDLLLLKRAATDMGAWLSIVSNDWLVINFGREIGIPVYTSIAEAKHVGGDNKRKTTPAFIPAITRSYADIQSLRFFLPREAEDISETWIRWLVFAICIVGLLTLGVLLSSSARVTIIPKKISQSSRFTMWANKEITTPLLSGGIPLYSMEIIVEGQDKIETQGHSRLPAGYSTGVVRFTNLTPDAVEIPVGTIVRTLDEPPQRFMTLAAARLEPRLASEVEVEVRNLNPGSGGNVTENAIRAVEGGIGLSVQVNNPQAIQGGMDKDFLVPGEAEYNSLKERLINALKETALQDMKQTLGANDYLLVDTLKMERIEKQTRIPEEGLPGDQLTLTLGVQFSAMRFSYSEVRTVVEATMDATKQAGFSSNPQSLTIVMVPGSMVVEGEMLHFQVDGRRDLISQWDEDQVVGALLGRRIPEAESILSASVALDKQIKVVTNPAWMPVFPILPSRIQINAE